MPLSTLRGKLAPSTEDSSLGFQARERRMKLLLERFPDFRDMRIVDLGGTVSYWKSTTVRPAHVTIVALEAWALENPEEWMTGVLGDACSQDTISGSFDLVFSNSVIEHVGGPRYRRDFAKNVTSLAPHHWIQTPYRYFPLEPHLMFPGFQFLPPVAKVAVAQHWPLSQMGGAEPVEYVMDHELLTVTEMRAIFPRSEILRERVGGIVKSLVALR